MADRYWVGGTGTWDATSTTNWSTSSGGAAGASAPTSDDSVFFDSNSNTGTGSFTVTVVDGSCLDFNVGTPTALDGSMTITGGALLVYGSWLNPATNFTCSIGSTIFFYATTTGKTITTNGVTLGTNCNLYFSGIGGEWTLGSNLVGARIYHQAGTLDTSTSNYSITMSGSFNSQTTSTRTLNLNGSTITTPSWYIANPANLTLNAGTSTIELTATSSSMYGGGKTYSNVSFTSNSATNNLKYIYDGSNTFGNLTFATIAAPGLNFINFYGNQTITGTLTVSGANGNQRQCVRSYLEYTPYTLTCAAIASMSDVDFRNITIAGAAGTLSGTRLGDCGGNSNITFPAAKTVYWSLAAGGDWRNSTAWATTSGGTPATTNYPLPQDTAIIQNTGLNTSATITTTNNERFNIGTLDASTRTNAMTLSGSSYLTFYGNVYYSFATTPWSYNSLDFVNSSTKEFDSAGKSLTNSFYIDCLNGGVKLVGNGITTTGRLQLTSGNLDLNNFPCSFNDWNSTNTQYKAASIAFGTLGYINLTGSDFYMDLRYTNFTFTGNGQINFTYTGSNFRQIACSFGANCPDFNFKAGTGNITLINYNSMDYPTLNFTGFSGNVVNNETFGTRIYGNLIFSSTMSTTYWTSPITLYSKSNNDVVNFNNQTLNVPISFRRYQSYYYGYTLQGNLTTNNYTQFYAGNINLNGKNLTTSTANTYPAETKNITFNGGNLIITGSGATAWDNSNNPYNNFTTTAGTGTGSISLTSSSAKTFVGGNVTYNCAINQGGTGNLTITGNNTFANITNSAQPANILFTAGTTTTLTNFGLAGNVGNLITITSATASNHTLSSGPGTINARYCNISRSTATGVANWQALIDNGNVDGGNNSGWIVQRLAILNGFFGFIEF